MARTVSIKAKIKALVASYNNGVKQALSKNPAMKKVGVRNLNGVMRRAATFMRYMGLDANDRRVLRSIRRKGHALLKKITAGGSDAQAQSTIRPAIRPTIRPGVAQHALATEMRPVVQAAIEANNAAVISTSAGATAEQSDEAAASIEEPEATEAIDAASTTTEASSEGAEEPTLFEKLWPSDKPVLKRPGLYVAGAIVLIGAMAMNKGSK